MLGLVVFALVQTSQIGSFDRPNQAAQQPFKSVGVRGTIDAGGYAASATVKTRTEFFQQLIDLQVSLLRPNACQAPKALHPAIELMRNGEFTSAATALETLLPTNAEPKTRQLLGLAYEGAGQLAAASEQFRIAASHAPIDSGSVAAHGIALLLEGDVDHAEATCRSSAKDLCLGVALFQKGQVKESLALFLDAATANSIEPAAFKFIAIAVRSADPATLTPIIDRLTLLLRDSPGNAGAHYALACALAAALNEGPDIETQLKRAAQLDPQLAEAHFQLGAIYAAREEWPDSIAEYQSALQDDPRLIEAHYRLGQIYSRTGQPQQAKQQLDLHQQLRTRQKSEIENGKVPVQLANLNTASCP